MGKPIIGCLWVGQLQKVEPDEYCHRCPFTLHSGECERHRKAYHAICISEGGYRKKNEG